MDWYLNLFCRLTFRLFKRPGKRSKKKVTSKTQIQFYLKLQFACKGKWRGTIHRKKLCMYNNDNHLQGFLVWSGTQYISYWCHQPLLWISYYNVGEINFSKRFLWSQINQKVFFDRCGAEIWTVFGDNGKSKYQCSGTVFRLKGIHILYSTI